jgi:hypothetical protein
MFLIVTRTCLPVSLQVPLPPGAKMPPRVVRTRWGTDDLFCGSYSYIGVGEANGDCVDTLAEPLVNDAGV